MRTSCLTRVGGMRILFCSPEREFPVTPDLLVRQFAHIGARLVVTPAAPRSTRPFDLDIRRDRVGEHFRLAVPVQAPDFQLLQSDRAIRHLLLWARANDMTDRLLCGHDERHWFVAGIAGR